MADEPESQDRAPSGEKRRRRMGRVPWGMLFAVVTLLGFGWLVLRALEHAR